LATSSDTAKASPYDRIGGLPMLRQITDRFYDLMESEPQFGTLRAMHAKDLAPMRESLPLFLAGWSGGPRDWWEANPGKCMVSLHGPFAIDGTVAGQWADAMRRAISETVHHDPAIAEAMADVLDRMARGMAKA